MFVPKAPIDTALKIFTDIDVIMWIIDVHEILVVMTKHTRYAKRTIVCAFLVRNYDREVLNVHG